MEKVYLAKCKHVDLDVVANILVFESERDCLEKVNKENKRNYLWKWEMEVLRFQNEVPDGRG